MPKAKSLRVKITNNDQNEYSVVLVGPAGVGRDITLAGPADETNEHWSETICGGAMRNITGIELPYNSSKLFRLTLTPLRKKKRVAA